MFGTTLSHLRSIDLTCCQRTFGLKMPTNLGAAGIPATPKSKFQAAKMRSQWGGSNPLFFIGLVRVKYGLDTTSVRVRKTRGFSTNPGFYLQKYGLVRVNNGLNTTSVRVWVSTLFFFEKKSKIFTFANPHSFVVGWKIRFSDYDTSGQYIVAKKSPLGDLIQTSWQ